MTKTKGNQKHLTLSQRIEIEKGLLDGKSFSAIAKAIRKDPSTISKEVRRNSKLAERKGGDFAPVPCTLRKSCSLMYLCEDNCGTKCKICRKKGMKCIDVCPQYKPSECDKLTRPPYVCNGCPKKVNCLLVRRVYSSKYAHDIYRDLLVSSRNGINQTPESIQKLNDVLTPLIKKGQSIAHIYTNHAEELECSRRTIYTYINEGVFDVRNIDLRRKVTYKPRRKATQTSVKDRNYRIGRNYEDFQDYIRGDYPTRSIVEMDTVEGKKGGKVFLTMMFRSCNLMLLFLLESKTQEEVKRVFDELTKTLGAARFAQLFEVILTDGGTEFQNPYSLEYTDDGWARCIIFFCDPYSSWQKGMLEKNHEYIRYVLPQGESFDGLTDDDVLLLTNHINNTARDSLNGCTPYQLSRMLLNNDLHNQYGLKTIAPDDVTLIPSLIKK
jgi:IS30 family transposase